MGHARRRLGQLDDVRAARGDGRRAAPVAGARGASGRGREPRRRRLDARRRGRAAAGVQALGARLWHVHN